MTRELDCIFDNWVIVLIQVYTFEPYYGSRTVHTPSHAHCRTCTSEQFVRLSRCAAAAVRSSRATRSLRRVGVHTCTRTQAARTHLHTNARTQAYTHTRTHYARMYPAVRTLVEMRTGGTRASQSLGRVCILTNLRFFGYVFNPVSIYYCWSEAGDRLEAVVLEVCMRTLLYAHDSDMQVSRVLINVALERGTLSSKYALHHVYVASLGSLRWWVGGVDRGFASA